MARNSMTVAAVRGRRWLEGVASLRNEALGRRKEACVRIAACAFVCVAIGVIAGCATAVVSEPVAYAPWPASPVRVATLASAVHVPLATGYARELAAGSRWRRVGRVPQGDVYRPVDTVFTIEGRQVHEAYLVVSGRSLVGFYLPGEARYSALPAPVTISFGDL